MASWMVTCNPKGVSTRHLDPSPGRRFDVLQGDFELVDLFLWRHGYYLFPVPLPFGRRIESSGQLINAKI